MPKCVLMYFLLFPLIFCRLIKSWLWLNLCLLKVIVLCVLKVEKWFPTWPKLQVCLRWSVPFVQISIVKMSIFLAFFPPFSRQIRNITSRAFAVVASALGIQNLCRFFEAVCTSKKKWTVRHTGIRTIQQLAILVGISVLPHLNSLIKCIKNGLHDEQKSVCLSSLQPFSRFVLWPLRPLQL